jgi:hypothetical protein
VHKLGAGLVVIIFLALAGGFAPRREDLGRSYAPGNGHLPRLIVDDSVAGDLQALAEETWGTFLMVFQARTGCFGDVRLHAARDLGDRAAYDPATAIVTIRVPASAVMLQGALIHEWAHHIEFQCDAHRALRPAFLAAQGLPADTPWRLSDTPASGSDKAWADSPSEQYAEAVIEVVLGRRQIPTTVRVRVEAVRVIRDWASAR